MCDLDHFLHRSPSESNLTECAHIACAIASLRSNKAVLILVYIWERRVTFVLVSICEHRKVSLTAPGCSSCSALSLFSSHSHMLRIKTTMPSIISTVDHVTSHTVLCDGWKEGIQECERLHEGRDTNAGLLSV